MSAGPLGKKYPSKHRASPRSTTPPWAGVAILFSMTCLCLMGCYAPAGSYEPYPPYGQPCVPPPPTGAIGTPPGGYYYPYQGSPYQGYPPYGYPQANPYPGAYPGQQPLQPITPLSNTPSTTSQSYLGPSQGNWQTARSTQSNLGYSSGAAGNERDRQVSSGARGNSLVWTDPRDMGVSQASWDQSPYTAMAQAAPVANVPYYGPYGESQVGIGVAAAPGPFVYSTPQGTTYSTPIRPSVVR
jgi:hypothetical protein